MKTLNAELMRMARESLKGKWGLAIAAFVIYFAISLVAQFIPILGIFINLIIIGPLVLGLSVFTLNLSRNQDARIEQLFEGFNNFVNALGTYLLMVVFIFLWMLLLIVPGIIAALSYSMAFYILADDPKVGPMEAIDKSKKMMYGYKWKLFCLYCRFIGWALLCILTLGIGFLWLGPYVMVSSAKFYDDIKQGSETSSTTETLDGNIKI
jgi:uncharacterized membrane protein